MSGWSDDGTYFKRKNCKQLLSMYRSHDVLHLPTDTIKYSLPSKFNKRAHRKIAIFLLQAKSHQIYDIPHTNDSLRKQARIITNVCVIRQQILLFYSHKSLTPPIPSHDNFSQSNESKLLRQTVFVLLLPILNVF